MKAHELAVITTKKSKRVGRGIAAGGGKTAGRGTKGQKARTGKKIKLGFEGGQTKLAARIPKKRGFTAKNRKSYVAISTDTLGLLKSTTVSNQSLHEIGVIKKSTDQAKLLAGSATIEKAYTVEIKSSAAAAKLIEKAGGKIITQAPTQNSELTKKSAKSQQDNSSN